VGFFVGVSIGLIVGLIMGLIVEPDYPDYPDYEESPVIDFIHEAKTTLTRIVFRTRLRHRVILGRIPTGVLVHEFTEYGTAINVNGPSR